MKGIAEFVSAVLFHQRERKDVRARGHGDVLPAVEHVVMGEAFQRLLVWKCQRGVPLEASTAMSAPLSSPKKTRPVAVARVPPQERAGPACGSSQAMAPVFTSIARRIF
jgi:hypothetical protein